MNEGRAEGVFGIVVYKDVNFFLDEQKIKLHYVEKRRLKRTLIGVILYLVW